MHMDMNGGLTLKYKIEKDDETVSIYVSGTNGKTDQVLKAFQSCQDGTCNCKTSEYKKVESFDIQTLGEHVQVVIKTKHNDVIDACAIEKCLEHTRTSLKE